MHSPVFGLTQKRRLGVCEMQSLCEVTRRSLALIYRINKLKLGGQVAHRVGKHLTDAQFLSSINVGIVHLVG